MVILRVERGNVVLHPWLTIFWIGYVMLLPLLKVVFSRFLLVFSYQEGEEDVAEASEVHYD